MAGAGVRGRGESFETSLVGTNTLGPRPDYASIAEGIEVRGYGSVTDPSELRKTL